MQPYLHVHPFWLVPRPRLCTVRRFIKTLKGPNIALNFRVPTKNTHIASPGFGTRFQSAPTVSHIFLTVGCDPVRPWTHVGEVRYHRCSYTIIESQVSLKTLPNICNMLYGNYGKFILCPREHGELLTMIKHDHDPWHMRYKTIWKQSFNNQE